MITHITCQHGLSGIGRYGFELTNRLHEEGIVDYWYKPFKHGHPDSYLHKHDWIKPYSYKSFRNWHPYVLPHFIRFGVKKTSDFAHAHWFLSGLGAIKKGYKKIVVTMHDVSLLHQSEQSGAYEAYYAKALETFKSRDIPIITVSETARKDAINYARYPDELVTAIPNGIDFQQFSPGIRQANDRFRIVYSGGLGKRKNLDLLLRAFQQVEKRFGSVELLVAGAHPERTEYPTLTEELGIKNVRFTGYLPDENMADFYRSGDLMVFPSLYEGFGFSPLEAMACGTPVLTATGGALQEISAPGAQTFEYSVDDLVEKISALIESEEKRNALASKGLAWVQQYSWGETVRKTRNVYKTLNMV